jgi:hypothetical protein
MDFIHLKLSWTTSRGADTYGWNICRLDDNRTGKRYKTMGGGYDMIGKVLGDWLQDNYQEQLKRLIPASIWDVDAKQFYDVRTSESYYGLSHNNSSGSVLRASLDGACGRECMIRIAKAVGLEVDYELNRRHHIAGFYVQPVKQLEAA